jgi:hypothetical protein
MSMITACFWQRTPSVQSANNTEYVQVLSAVPDRGTAFREREKEAQRLFFLASPLAIA